MTRNKAWREGQIVVLEVRHFGNWLIAHIKIDDHYVRYQWRGSDKDVHIHALVRCTNQWGDYNRVYRRMPPTSKRYHAVRERVHRMIERGELVEHDALLTPSPT